MIWWIGGSLLLIAGLYTILAIPWGPGQPLWMDLRDWLVRRVRLWP
jgi:hypothetical protein